jgi:hypothetical protein
MTFTRFETVLLVLLFASVSALAVCLALVWMQFQKLANRQLRLVQEITEQLRQLFTIFNDKFSREIARHRREAKGAEQELTVAVGRKLDDVQELVNRLQALETAFGKLKAPAPAASHAPEAKELPTAKEARSGFSVFTREKKG